MRKSKVLGLALMLTTLALATGSRAATEALLIRHPHHHSGRVAFSYMGDIWTADDSGKQVQRLTAHRGRDIAPRFSPDGKSIAFSSDRGGNLDLWLIPSEGGKARQLTFHSADDTLLGWSPDGKRLLFASSRGEDFLGTLYTVDLEGNAEVRAGTDYGMYGSFSPDGKKLAVNRKGQSYWRQGYRGAYQTDVTVVDLEAKTFKDVTDFNGMDSWPMWATDGRIYFVSDRDPGARSNIWRVPQEGGPAERVTEFDQGDLRFPSLGTDGKTIVFERDFRLWKLDTATKKAEPLRIDIAAETQETLEETRSTNSEVDDYDVAPTGRAAIVSVRGDLFSVPTGDEGEVVQVTRGAARDRDIEFSPDGKSIAFVSDIEPTREEIFIIPADGTSEPKRITDVDALKSSFTWSPDGKSIAFTTSDGALYRIASTGGAAKKLLDAKFGALGRPAWSPDGSLLAFHMEDATRTEEIYIMPSDGGEPRKATFDSANDRNPRFSADGKKLYFLRTEMSDSGGAFGGLSSSLMVAFLEKQEKDPDLPTTVNSPRGGPGGAATSIKPPAIDWAGLERRTRPVFGAAGRGSGGPGRISAFVPGLDGRTLFLAASGGGQGGPGPGGIAALLGGGSSIYSCTDDGKNLRQLSGGVTQSAGGESDGERGRGFGGRGGVGNLRLTRDGRTLFFQEGNAVYSVGAGGGSSGIAAMMSGRLGSMRGPGGSGGPDSTPGSGSSPSSSGSSSGSRKKLSFSVVQTIDKPSEWHEVFHDAWRTMKYRFYDPKLHGIDWEASRKKYAAALPHVADRAELVALMNEMIGELNASHTGASMGGGRSSSDPNAAPPVQTLHLGFDVEPDAASGRYRVAHVYADTPLDKDWIKISKGDYLISLDGKSVKSGDNLWKLLTNRRLNKKLKVMINSKPTEEGAWKLEYEPISWSSFADKRYERWVKERQAMTEKLSGDRIGYLHIRAMDQTSLRKFERDLRANRDKEALVIDQRFNGGGNIEQELLAILVQRPYQIWHPRGTEPTTRPFRGFFGPKVVLQNWRSASNAEMFPAGFRALGLGKVIGTPTMGAVIGTGSYSLIDGTQIRTPGVGVFLADTNRTNMENFGVMPDILVENTPEDNLAGRDRQLEKAVAELMKQIPPKPVAEAAGGAAGR
ncbi:MAG: S41 family peptidase [Isosphaeraceae bacterium]|nr:S41 family peptidase [Isosphaeraceae bacterium]